MPCWREGRLQQAGTVAAARSSGLKYGRVDADVSMVLLDNRAKDTWVTRQAPLRQGRHDAPRAGSVDSQPDVANRERFPDPVVLDEASRAVGRLEHEVGAEPRDLEAARGCQGPKAVERRRRDD